METTHEISEVFSLFAAAGRLRGQLSSVSAWGEGLGPEIGVVPQNGIILR